MSAQSGPTIYHKDKHFSLIDAVGDGLFSTTQLGLKLVGLNSGCMAGERPGYEIIDKVLYLTSLDAELNFMDNVAIDKHLGVSPKKGDFLGYRYEGFRKRVAYTGRMRIGRDIAPKPFWYWGRFPVWCYKNVRALKFENGDIVSDKGISARIAKIRNRLIAEEKRTGVRLGM